MDCGLWIVRPCTIHVVLTISGEMYGGNMFFENVGNLLQDCMASQARRSQFTYLRYLGVVKLLQPLLRFRMQFNITFISLSVCEPL
jgi:hypothetical protein